MPIFTAGAAAAVLPVVLAPFAIELILKRSELKKSFSKFQSIDIFPLF
jgi:hypothetical protein